MLLFCTVLFAVFWGVTGGGGGGGCVAEEDTEVLDSAAVSLGGRKVLIKPQII